MTPQRIIPLACLLLCASCQLFKPSATELASPPPPSGEPSTIFYSLRHTPLHPADGESVQYHLDVSDTAGIAKIELFVYEYELYRNTQGLPSKRKRQGGRWGLLNIWRQAVPYKERMKIMQPVVMGYPPATNIEYVFRITDRYGRSSEQMVSFDAGTSPWPQDKILLYSMHSDPLKYSINSCFLPDTDYGGDWQQFLEDTESLIYQGYHQNNMIEGHKEKWAFFYTRQSVDGLALSQDFGNPTRYPAFMKDTLIYGIDAFALLHLNEYSDGAYMHGNIHFLAQNLFTSESYNWGTAVHESAHAIFNLSDEYDGCACFESMDGSNVFRTLGACQLFNRQLNVPESDCRAIQHLNGNTWYISEPNVYFDTREECEAYNLENGHPLDRCELFQDIHGQRFYRALDGLCIMQDDGDRRVPNFQRTCSSVIQRYYRQLDDGNAPSVAAEETQDNMYGYQPIVLAELDLNEADWGVALRRMEYGIPHKTVKHPVDFQLEIEASDGQPLYRLFSDRPDCVHIHDSSDKDGRHISGKGKVYMALPYLINMTQVKCTSTQYGRQPKGGKPQQSERKLKVKDQLSKWRDEMSKE